MSQERDYTRHQRAIIRRYYANQGRIATQRLGELVSEIYLATSDKKAARLWEQVEKHLSRTDADPTWVRKMVADRNVEWLAEMVSELF
jgi:hypothetical protein